MVKFKNVLPVFIISVIGFLFNPIMNLLEVNIKIPYMSEGSVKNPLKDTNTLPSFQFVLYIN